MSRRFSWTEKRRSRLRMQCVHLEVLESKHTITEPISVLGLSVSAFRGLAQMGLVDVNAMRGVAPPVQTANQARHPASQAGAALGNFIPIVIGHATHNPTAAGGGGAPQQDGTAQAPLPKVKVQPGVWPTLLPASAADSSQSGISAPWHPASHTGGGAALAPRGGWATGRWQPR
jgi:hypothetical protein